ALLPSWVCILALHDALPIYVGAPVAIGDAKAIEFTYDEACEFVIEHFESFGPELTSFTKHALENRWVEAEDRPNKRPGGYCTNLDRKSTRLNSSHVSISYAV